MCNVAGALLPKRSLHFLASAATPPPCPGDCCCHVASIADKTIDIVTVSQSDLVREGYCIVDCGLCGYYYNKVDVISFLIFVCRENCRSIDSSRAVY